MLYAFFHNKIMKRKSALIESEQVVSWDLQITTIQGVVLELGVPSWNLGCCPGTLGPVLEPGVPSWNLGFYPRTWGLVLELRCHPRTQGAVLELGLSS